MSDQNVISASRRRLLLGAASGLATMLLPPWAQAGEWAPWSDAGQPAGQQGPGAPGSSAGFWNKPRVISLRRLQNTERVHVTYWRDGGIDPTGYGQVCWLMRDLKANTHHPIDVRVLDLLCAMQAWVGHYGFTKPFVVSSGYRTQRTNERLEGAARNSMHLYGKAVDLIFPDLPVSYLGQLAQHYSAGGVGFYPSRGFVHVDTGRLRTWGAR